MTAMPSAPSTGFSKPSCPESTPSREALVPSIECTVSLIGTSSRATSGALGLTSEKSKVTAHVRRRPVTQATLEATLDADFEAWGLAFGGGGDGVLFGGGFGTADGGGEEVGVAARGPLCEPQHAAGEEVIIGGG